MMSALSLRPFTITHRETVLVVAGLLAAVIATAVLQDFLHSARNGYPFFLNESLLFQSFWLLFPPLLVVIKRYLDSQSLSAVPVLGMIIAGSTLVHLLLAPLVVWALSSLFRDQSYGYGKVLTFMLANDLVKISLVYLASVIWFKCFPAGKEAKETIRRSKTLSIKSGKRHTLIDFEDIVCIRSATPYVEIEAGGKQFLHTASLQSCMAQLDDRFVRVHRSSIVNAQKVLSFHSRLNGDYDLHLSDGATIRLSRNYARQFKARFEQTSA